MVSVLDCMNRDHAAVPRSARIRRAHSVSPRNKGGVTHGTTDTGTIYITSYEYSYIGVCAYRIQVPPHNYIHVRCTGRSQALCGPTRGCRPAARRHSIGSDPPADLRHPPRGRWPAGRLGVVYWPATGAPSTSCYRPATTRAAVRRAAALAAAVSLIAARVPSGTGARAAVRCCRGAKSRNQSRDSLYRCRPRHTCGSARLPALASGASIDIVT